MEPFVTRCERCKSTKSGSWRWVRVGDKKCQIWCVECCASHASVLNPEGTVIMSNPVSPVKEVG